MVWMGRFVECHFSWDYQALIVKRSSLAINGKYSKHVNVSLVAIQSTDSHYCVCLSAFRHERERGESEMEQWKLWRIHCAVIKDRLFEHISDKHNRRVYKWMHIDWNETVQLSECVLDHWSIGTSYGYCAGAVWLKPFATYSQVVHNLFRMFHW